MNPKLVSQTPEFYPQEGKPAQGWTFGGFLTIEPGSTGRGANTLWWMGLANCFWWIDREKGVAGFLGSQVSLRDVDMDVVVVIRVRVLMLTRCCRILIPRLLARGLRLRRRFTII